MIDESLKDFMDKVEIKNKNIAIYKNEEKGLIYPLSVATLLTRVDYLELTKQELEKALFEGKIDKKEYKMYDCERLVPKNTVTRDKKDQYTITTSQVKATHIYNVSNQAGIHTTFENKEDAFKLCEEINNQIIESL
jgi:hypothetical protein